jgi:hypothetical protein
LSDRGTLSPFVIFGLIEFTANEHAQWGFKIDREGDKEWETEEGRLPIVLGWD